jgi:hypothetical protein
MAIEFIKNIITSGYNLTKINDNFDKIETALQDGLSRSGEGPNQMNADLDMNGFGILNLNGLEVNGQDIGEFIEDIEEASQLAQKWAENPEDVPVTPGHYSSLHWATKAEDNHVAGVAGVASFNGRTLAVVPAVNDYTSAQVQHGAGSVSTKFTSVDAAIALKADSTALTSGLALKLNKAGDTMSGDLNMGGNDITNVATINGAAVGGGLNNYAENGNFEHATNNKVASTPPFVLQFAVDRWVNRNNGTTGAHSRQTFTLGQTDVPSASYYLRTVVTSVAGVSNYSELDHPLEGLAKFAGKQLTVTFWAKADSSKNISFFTTQYFGAGGSTNVHANQRTLALTNAWQKFSFTVNFASLLGKTIGTDKREATLFRWVFDVGATNAATYGITALQQSGTFELAHVSIVDGDATSVADPFQAKHIAETMANDQRYYEKGNHVWTADVTNLGVYIITIPFKTTKISVNTPGYTINGTLTNLTLTSVSQTDRALYITVTSNNSGVGKADYDWTADYEL